MASSLWTVALLFSLAVGGAQASAVNHEDFGSRRELDMAAFCEKHNGVGIFGVCYEVIPLDEVKTAKNKGGKSALLQPNVYQMRETCRKHIVPHVTNEILENIVDFGLAKINAAVELEMLKTGLVARKEKYVIAGNERHCFGRVCSKLSGFICSYEFKNRTQLPSLMPTQFPKGVTPVDTTQAEIKKNVLDHLKPLLRGFNHQSKKHVYQHDLVALSSFLSKGYTREANMGKVLPYKSYEANKAKIDSLCPDLVTVYEYKNGTKQVFSKDASLAGLEKKGAFMKGSLKKGYCGANTPLYRLDSAPVNNNVLYTTDMKEYDQLRKTSAFYQEPLGKAKGVVFYVWN
uniref:SCP domain-containing protein n=1 Tax=Steinernema glaseri TaxID=37863 RepID=A0A1I7YT44_9BILA